MQKFKEYDDQNKKSKMKHSNNIPGKGMRIVGYTEDDAFDDIEVIQEKYGNFNFKKFKSF